MLCQLRFFSTGGGEGDWVIVFHVFLYFRSSSLSVHMISLPFNYPLMIPLHVSVVSPDLSVDPLCAPTDHVYTFDHSLHSLPGPLPLMTPLLCCHGCQIMYIAGQIIPMMFLDHAQCFVALFPFVVTVTTQRHIHTN